MSDLVETIDGKRGLSRTEHVLRSVLIGSIENVRPRLVQALEQMGYNVLTDAPLYARRRARGLARHYLSANILEYPVEITIGLREIGQDSTLATFDYVLKHPGGMSFKGDQHTLTREAEAIIAIAASDQSVSSCSSCGTAQASEGRFCRVCGAPTIISQPAELEILRITAESRAGHHLITSGAVISAGGAIAALAIALFAGSAGVIPIAAMFGVIVVGLLLVFFGIAKLSSALNPGEPVKQMYPTRTTAELATPAPPALHSSPASVTEGTTSLLSKTSDPREKQSVVVKDRDTLPMDR
jgi:hypothetical protein